jgi:hypothetical protein
VTILCTAALRASCTPHATAGWIPRAAGRRLVEEQDLINSHKLSEVYMKPQRKMGRSLIGLSG